MQNLIDNLVENSKAAMMAAIEIHNKPIFPYRYEVTTVLVINAWELLLKAYILTNHPKVKVIRDDGTTKPFEECLSFVASNLGKNFTAVLESTTKIYDFRCNFIHFFSDEIDLLLFSLLRPNVIYYSEFLNNHFGIDLADETNLILLPIGFKAHISPVDFISQKSQTEESSPAVQSFIKSIVKSAQDLESQGITDSILVDYRMAVINEHRVKNADIIAGITKDKNTAKVHVGTILGEVTISDESTAKKIRIEEENLYRDFYTETYQDVVNYCYENFTDFKKNNNFNAVMKNFKGNSQYHRKRYLDFLNKKGGSKDYYSKAIYDELAKHYTLNRESDTQPTASS